MRRSLASCALVGLLAVGGCSNFRTLFSAHRGAAAEAGGQELTVDKLSRFLGTSKGAPLNRDVAQYVAQLWVDYALFAQGAATGTLPTDSASVAVASWSEIAEIRERRWHDTLVARRATATPAQADSAYQANDVRVLQHILFRLPHGATPSVKAAAKKKAEGAAAKLRGGADFGTLASQLSEDPGTKVDSGFLPPSRRGQFVPTFDSIGWSLAPGATSGIVESPFGYHIIRRPAAEAVRGRLVKFLVQRASAHFDSLYMDSLATGNKIEVNAGAPALMKAALDNPAGERKSSKVLVTFKGGTLAVSDFVHWLEALPPQYHAQLKSVPDSMLQRFAKVLTQNILMLRAADSAKVYLTADEWKGIMARQTATIEMLRNEMGLAAVAQDSAKSVAERKKLATAKVDEYFDGVLKGQRRLYPISPSFAGLLRDRGASRVYAAGVNRALELAKAAQASDTTAAPGAASAPFKRAPGPPPVPTAPAAASAPAAPAPAGAAKRDPAGHTPGAKK